MINTNGAQLAFRAIALGLNVCTTGMTSLSATATGYARASGSFVDDGFERGHELTPEGFAASASELIIDVQPTLITVDTTHAVQSASAGRTLSVGLPAIRFWEDTTEYDVAGNPIGRVTDRWYITEEMDEGGGGLITSGGAHRGLIEQDLIYTLTLFAVSGYGPNAVRTVVQALRDRYAPGTRFSVGAFMVRCGLVRGGNSLVPHIGELVPAGGWTACQLQVFALAKGRNLIAG